MALNRELRNSPAYFDLSKLQFAIGQRVMTSNGTGVIKGVEYWEVDNELNMVPGVHYTVLITETPLYWFLNEPEIFEASEIVAESEFIKILLWVAGRQLRSLKQSSPNCPPTVSAVPQLSPR